MFCIQGPIAKDVVLFIVLYYLCKVKSCFFGFFFLGGGGGGGGGGCFCKFKPKDCRIVVF